MEMNNPLLCTMALASVAMGVQAQAVTDVTNSITNANFEDGNNGWNGGVAMVPDSKNCITGKSAESYAWVAADNNFNYTQVLKNLSAGRYLLSADMFNSLNEVSGEPNSGQAGMYVIVNGKESRVVVPTKVEVTPVRDMAENYGITFEVPEGGADVTIGFKNFETMTARWFVFDNVRLHSGIIDKELCSRNLASQINRIGDRTDSWLDKLRIEASRIQARINNLCYKDLGEDVPDKIDDLKGHIDNAVANYDLMQSVEEQCTKDSYDENGETKPTLHGLLGDYAAQIAQIEEEVVKQASLENYGFLEKDITDFQTEANDYYMTFEENGLFKHKGWIEGGITKIKGALEVAINAKGTSAIFYSQFIQPLTDAKNIYKNALTELYVKLSSPQYNQLYNVLYVKSLSDLGACKTELDAVASEAEGKYKDNSFTEDNLVEYISRLNEVNGEVERIKQEYVGMRDNHIAATKDIDQNVYGVEGEDGKYDVEYTYNWLKESVIGTCKTVLDANQTELGKIKVDVDKLYAAIDSVKNDFTIVAGPEFYKGYGVAKQAIINKVTTLYNKVQPEVDNWDAYQYCLSEVADLRKDFEDKRDNKETGLASMVSEDGVYKATGKYPAEEETITDALADYEAKAKAAYDRYEKDPANAAVKYKAEFDKAFLATKELVSTYYTNAEAAFGKYTEVVNSIAEYEKALGELDEIVKDRNVTVGGDPKSEVSYKNKLEEFEENKKNLQTALGNAVVTTEKHYNAMVALNLLELDEITTLKGQYGEDETKYNQQSLEAAKADMVEKIRSRIEDARNVLESVTLSEEVHGIGYKALQDEYVDISKNLDDCNDDLQDAIDDTDPTTAIALLATMDETLQGIENQVNNPVIGLVVRANKAAEKVAQEISIKEELTGKIAEYRNTITEAESEAGYESSEQEDLDKKADFTDRIGDLRNKLTQISKEIDEDRAKELLNEHKNDYKEGDVEHDGYDNRLNQLKDAADQLKDDVEEAKKNYEAYVALQTMLGSFSFNEAIVTEETEIKEVSTGVGQEHYLAELDNCRTELANIENDIKQAHKDGTAAKKISVLSGRMSILLSKVEKLSDSAKQNEDAHKELNTKYTELYNYWAGIRDYIAEQPASSAHNEAMTKLSDYQKSIDEKVADIKKDFGEGTFGTPEEGLQVKENYISAANDIHGKIGDLREEWNSDYQDAVRIDNKERYDAFDKARKSASATYSATVTLIAELKNTSSADGFEDDLQGIGSNEGLYQYATKLTEEIKKADTEYNEAQLNLPKLYDPQLEHVKTMQSYENEIKSICAKYVKEVNDKARASYTECRKTLNERLAAEKRVMTDWGWYSDVVDAAFPELTDALTKADNENVETNDRFAVDFESFLAIYDDRESLIAEGQNAAAAAQWKKETETLDALTATEVKEMKTFCPQEDIAPLIDAYEQCVEQYKKAKVEKAKLSSEQLYGNMKTLEDKFSQLRNITKVDGQEHTVLYQQAYQINKDYQSNETAYTENMTVAINSVKANLDAFKGYVSTLIVAHHNTIESFISARQFKIKLAEAKALEYYDAKTAHDHISEIETVCKTISNDIENGYGRVVIPQEKDAMGSEIEALKLDYDRALGVYLNLPEDTPEEKDEKQKKINELDEYKGRIDDYKEDNTTLYSSFVDKLDKDAAHAGYISLEEKVAVDRYELAAIYDENLSVKAQSDIEEAMQTVAEKCTAVQEAWDKAHEKVQSQFNDRKVAFADAVANEQQKIQTSIEKHTILLYESVLKADIEAIDNLYANLLKEINDADEPFKTNEACWETLKDELVSLQARLDKVNEVAEGYKYGYYTQGYRESETATLTYYIDSDALFIESLYKDCALKPETTLLYADIVRERTTKLEYYLAYYNADRILSYDIAEKISNIDLSSALYRDEDLQTLREEKVRLERVCNNLSRYSNAVYKDNFIVYTIDGEPIVDENGNKGMVYTDYMQAYKDIMDRLDLGGENGVEKAINDLKNAAALVSEGGLGYQRGDANLDGDVNVADYVEVRNMALEIVKVDKNEIKFHAADINKDGKVNIQDVVMVNNIILYGNKEGELETNNVARRFELYDENLQKEDDVVSVAVEGKGTAQRIAISLDNVRDYVGLQMDVKLPEGVKVVNEILGARVENHDLAVNDVNGVHRVMVSTLENETLGNDGVVVYLDVEVSADYAGGNIEVNNILCADADAHVYQANGLMVGDATSITELSTVEKATSKIYNIGGQMMDTLKKGINIIVNSDGTTKKVLKK